MSEINTQPNPDAVSDTTPFEQVARQLGRTTTLLIITHEFHCSIRHRLWIDHVLMMKIQSAVYPALMQSLGTARRELLDAYDEGMREVMAELPAEGKELITLHFLHKKFYPTTQILAVD